MEKLISSFFVFVFIITIFFFFDFGFLRGEITEYPLLCDKEDYINYQCTKKWLPLRPSTYKPNISKQHVLSWTSGLHGIETLKKCSVVSRKNWTCKYSDESAEFGFKNGQYWEVSLSPSITHELYEYKHVPKLLYRLEQIK